MAKGYLIAQVTVTNSDAYSNYAKVAGDLLKQYGACVVVKPETALIKEGNPKARTVIFEFGSFDRAKEFWDSPEYAEAKALRAGAADADFILIEGTD
ncbi:hypothetical protein B5V01_29070 [Mesorhizobium erdmanii]|uniref:DUF1330 domain-containing protein n=2 Tax=Mesorhizobium TaxID=68287 RepID=A0A3M9X0Z6_9HYPH|nr:MULTISPECIES: DUF1330 domain-containing protein [Mesorhizobium]RNJ41525.1 DUF1330 domain-containing protein [Mesorhizobium japonicum]RXT37468.1 hypothetical protein B5V01_29070 [Mesorhizobium erdmanii]